MSVYDKRENKQPYIDNWKSKGAEWCATQLWNARKQCSRLRNELYGKGFSLRNDSFKEHQLREANNTLENLLHENGIKPQRLIVEYVDEACEYPEEWCDLKEDCYNCKWFKETNIVKTFQFYSWDIAGGTLSGILRNLEKARFELIRLIDDETKTVLYEKKD